MGFGNLFEVETTSAPKEEFVVVSRGARFRLHSDISHGGIDECGSVKQEANTK